MSMAMASSRRSWPFFAALGLANAVSDFSCVCLCSLAFHSGRLDSNQRPHGPEPCALAKLSYAPWFVYRNCRLEIVNGSDPKRVTRAISLSFQPLASSYHGAPVHFRQCGNVAKTDTFV